MTTDIAKGKVRVWQGTVVLTSKTDGAHVSTTPIICIERKARGKRHQPGKVDSIGLDHAAAWDVYRDLGRALGIGRCPECDGFGDLPTGDCEGPGTATTVQCDRCGGSGEDPTSRADGRG